MRYKDIPINKFTDLHFIRTFFSSCEQHFEVFSHVYFAILSQSCFNEELANTLFLFLPLRTNPIGSAVPGGQREILNVFIIISSNQEGRLRESMLRLAPVPASFAAASVASFLFLAISGNQE